MSMLMGAQVGGEEMPLASQDAVLITGAAGFVGSAVARALCAQHVRLRVIVRDESARGNLDGLDAEIVTGDLRDRGMVDQAMHGIRHVFHVAADYRLWAPNPADIIANNLAMTRNVMEAALAAGVERIVYTSSVATIPPAPGGVADETADSDRYAPVGAYKQSKLAAERLVNDMVATRGLPAVIVNPSTPIGPRDIKPTPTGRIIVEAASGRMPAYVDTGLNLAHVDDIAAGHLAALNHGRIGERYILGGQDVALGEMLNEIARQTGSRGPVGRLPAGPLMPLAWLNEIRCRLTGDEPFLTLDGLRMARQPMYYSSAKAQGELDYRARDWREAVADALDWFGDAGMVA